MSDQFLGQLSLVGFNFPPLGWASAAGQLLSISSNTALFSLLGTTYGGDGKSNYALPNLQGMVAVGVGQGPGLQNYVQGESGGATTVTLTLATVPPHTHSLQVSPVRANLAAPGGNAFGDAANAGGQLYTATATPLNSMAPAAVSVVGGNGPHNNLMPYLALNWIIAMQGLFPPRS